jgi:prepilin-type N-terminal cleavage/methylation domain-containing protein
VRGLTLVEVMTAMFILVILTTMAVSLYIQGSQHFARTSTDLDAEREARAAMGYTEAELRQAMPPIGVPGGVPVVSPVAPVIANPSPTPTSQVVFYKVADIASAVSGTTINVGALTYDKVVIEPDPTASAPPCNLIEYVYDETGSTLLDTRIIGHDVQTFAVTPLRPDSYALQIVTAPNIRKDMLDPTNPGLYTYSLTSTVFISYYPTNN